MFRYKFSFQHLILLIALYVPLASNAQWEDRHSTEALVAALRDAIPDQSLSKSREFDDRLMATGELDGSNVYLVTDARSNRVNTMVRKLLTAMEEDSSHWVVRVFDTNPPIENAFVTGGKYIYVFTGLIDKASGDDELAFVLGHELGHSLLQHNERRSSDWTQQLAVLAQVAASINGSDSLETLTAVLKSDYSQVDEQEADAIGVAIATRADYNALRGADFFVRQVRAQEADAEELEQYRRDLDQRAADLNQQYADCTYLTQNWDNIEHNEHNVALFNENCGTYNERAQSYTRARAQFDALVAQQNIQTLTSSHPESQSRVAAIAALSDFILGRRNLASLAPFGQGHRVMAALTQVESVLLQPPEEKPMSAQPATVIGNSTGSSPSLAEQLSELKQIYDQGLISKDEYEEMRMSILERY